MIAVFILIILFAGMFFNNSENAENTETGATLSEILIPFEYDKQDSDSPVFLSVSAEPQKVKVGDTLTITAEIKDKNGIDKVSAIMPHNKGADEIQLFLISGNNKNGKYQGQWKVYDTHNKEYITTITAINILGKTTIQEVSWWDDVETTWYDSNWPYRKKITIDPITPEINYQVKVELTTAIMGDPYTNVKANGDDIRFCEADGTVLDYWIETYNAAGTSTIWVEVASSSADRIYIYYGNEGVGAVSDRTSVFSYKTYDFTDAVNNDAYYGKDSSASTPVAIDRATWEVAGAEFASGDYTNISASNDGRVSITTDAGTSQQIVHDFVFTIAENSGSNRIYSMTPFWEGYGSNNNESEAENDLRMYFLNINTSAFELKDSKLDNSCPGATDCSMTSALNSVDTTIANYFSGTYFRFLVQKYEKTLGGLGVSCSVGSDCLSGYCVDGVCCNSACNTSCVACNIAGSIGTCANIATNTDPDTECGGSSCCGYCNGAGACAYVASGLTCSSPGNVCTATHYRCDGSGSCTAPVVYAWSECHTYPNVSCADWCGIQDMLCADDPTGSHLHSDDLCTEHFAYYSCSYSHWNGNYDWKCFCGYQIYD